MKQFLLLLPMLMALAASPSFAAVPAQPSNLPGANAAALEQPTVADSGQKQVKKAGFLQKMATKAVVRKIRRGLAAAADGGTVAVLAHLTIIGWLIAFFQNKDKPTSLGGYHLAQTTGLFLTAILTTFLTELPVIGWVALLVLLVVLVNWVAGLIHAINGEEKPMPIGGRLFDRWFRRYF